ncbi:MAG: hypothetical protein QM751_05840 [Paludibacteraceae bacterium]
MPKELSAIYHEDKKELEFIFSLLDDKEIFLCRTTKFYYKYRIGHRIFRNFRCIRNTAKGFVEIDVNSETNYRNLRIFRDYLKKIQVNLENDFLQIKHLFHLKFEENLMRLIMILLAFLNILMFMLNSMIEKLHL